MNVFQRLHEEYLALNARVRTLETQVQALARELTGTIQEVGRLRDQVQSSADRKPPVPGGPRDAEGNTRDTESPPRTEEPDSKPVGRPNTKARLVRQFLLDALEKQDHHIGTVLCRECRQQYGVSEDTFWRVSDSLVAAGAITKEGGKGTGRPTELHRVPQKAPAPQNPGLP
jgi:hypothetical protein